MARAIQIETIGIGGVHDMDFYFEYEFPPMRGIYTTEIKADNEEQAREYFKIAYPKARIRKFEWYGFAKLIH